MMKSHRYSRTVLHCNSFCLRISAVVFVSVCMLKTIIYRAPYPETHTSKSSGPASSDQYKGVVNNIKYNTAMVEMKNKGAIYNNSDYTSNISQKKMCHIGFLKVHKAGSSTMQNIFFRFGIKHGLTFVLPSKNNYLKTEVPILPVDPDGHYDVLAVHSTYSKHLYDTLLPSDSVTIGIVREPFDRVVSAAYYYRYTFHKKYLREIPEKRFIRQLVNKAEIYDTELFSPTKNAMGKDFGFSPNLTVADVTKINEHLEFLKKEFKLVLIMERFEESLILLKRYLNWHISDILFIKNNVNTYPSVDKKLINMEIFRKINFLDHILYETFTNELSIKIEQEGDDFHEEVGFFKSVLVRIDYFCGRTANTESKMVVSESKWGKGFDVFKQDCVQMKMDENKMLENFRKRHRNMYKDPSFVVPQLPKI